MAGRIKVKKDEENPETTEVLAEAVIKISKGLNELEKSGLNERAIIVLVHDYTRVSKGTIKNVIDGLRQLQGYYCR